MGELLVENKQVVVPGEKLAEGMDYVPGEGTYRLSESVLAHKLGLVSILGRSIKLIPLAGRYLPKRGDVIIGRVIDVTISGWRLDTNSAYSALLNMKDATSNFIQRGTDLTNFYDVGDYVVAKIVGVTSQNLVDLTTKGPGLRKLQGGRIIIVNPYKVPRIIGKQGSMVSMLKEETGCRIVVGQNGVVWVDGEPSQENLAVATIKKITQESHLTGLTERIKAFLSERKGGSL